MGQKTNPISLRLQNVNRNFDSSWYSDYFYAKCFSRELYLRNYFDTFLKLLKLPQARIAVNFGIENTKLYPFFCIPKTSRVFLAKNLGLYQQLSKAWQLRSNIENNLINFPNNSIRKKTKTSTSLNNNLFFEVNNGFNEKLISNIVKFSPKVDILSSQDPLSTHQSWGKMSRINKASLNYIENLSVRLLLNHKSLNSSEASFTKLQNFSSTSGSGLVINEPNSMNHYESKELIKALLYKHYGLTIFKNKIIQQNIKEYEEFLFKNKTNNQLYKTAKNYNISTKVSVNKNKENSNSPLYFMPTTSDLLSNVYLANSSFSSRVNLNISSSLNIQTIPSVLYNNKELIVRQNFKYKNYIENFLSSQFNIDLQLFPFLSKQNWQSAGFIADEIVYFLERRVSFSRIKNRILKQASMQPFIRGIRITCSGRVGGKSKKAQRATQECVKYGETSLHVFDCKIDFAARNAFTSFGTVGIKVWVCFK